jgi:hypothetical protein
VRKVGSSTLKSRDANGGKKPDTSVLSVKCRKRRGQGGIHRIYKIDIALVLMPRVHMGSGFHRGWRSLLPGIQSICRG